VPHAPLGIKQPRKLRCTALMWLWPRCTRSHGFWLPTNRSAPPCRCAAARDLDQAVRLLVDNQRRAERMHTRSTRNGLGARGNLARAHKRNQRGTLTDILGFRTPLKCQKAHSRKKVGTSRGISSDTQSKHPIAEYTRALGRGAGPGLFWTFPTPKFYFNLRCTDAAAADPRAISRMPRQAWTRIDRTGPPALR